MALSLREKLTDILIKGNLIKKKDLDKAIEIQKISGGSLGRILVDQNLISQKSLIVGERAVGHTSYKYLQIQNRQRDPEAHS